MGHLVQHPCSSKDFYSRLVQAGLKYLQRSRLHNLPGQPVPVLRHPQREEVPPHVQMELPVPQFVPIAPCPDSPDSPWFTVPCPCLSPLTGHWVTLSSAGRPCSTEKFSLIRSWNTSFYKVYLINVPSQDFGLEYIQHYLGFCVSAFWVRICVRRAGLAAVIPCRLCWSADRSQEVVLHLQNRRLSLSLCDDFLFSFLAWNSVLPGAWSYLSLCQPVRCGTLRLQRRDAWHHHKGASCLNRQINPHFRYGQYGNPPLRVSFK